jgi:hypothetical protein
MAMNLTYDGFEVLTKIVQNISDTHCEGKLALVLKGGGGEHPFFTGQRRSRGALGADGWRRARTLGSGRQGSRRIPPVGFQRRRIDF